MEPVAASLLQPSEVGLLAAAPELLMLESIIKVHHGRLKTKLGETVVVHPLAGGGMGKGVTVR